MKPAKAVVLTLALLSAAQVSAADGTNDPVRTVAEVSAAIRAKTRHTHFELSVRALTPARKDGAHVFLAEDATGRELFFLFPEKDPSCIKPGVLLDICGETGQSGETAIRAFAWSAVPTGQTQPTQPALCQDHRTGHRCV